MKKQLSLLTKSPTRTAITCCLSNLVYFEANCTELTAPRPRFQDLHFASDSVQRKNVGLGILFLAIEIVYGKHSQGFPRHRVLNKCKIGSRFNEMCCALSQYGSFLFS